ncbi:circadian clock KaiB family protein [Ramlibacter sp. PS3R-8]|uniref:circadian clock KaiB family protein n=1 Tax=Ramlibacter sp. PS3R-8 TaxID=3133437 RepID=UPI003098D119
MKLATTMAPVPVVRFRLYVAGDTPNSVLALANLNAFCDDRFPGRYDIEIVDVFDRPEEALREGVFMTPLLVKLSPLPQKRIVGTLGSPAVVMHALVLSD